MINYEEELKKFHPSLDVNEAEDAIYSRDLTDITDILKEMLQEENKLSLIHIYRRRCDLLLLIPIY